MGEGGASGLKFEHTSGIAIVSKGPAACPDEAEGKGNSDIA